MTGFLKRYLSVVPALLLVCSLIIPGSADTVTGPTEPTSYTKATDVVYLQDGGYIANWGARNEDCLFLSVYAVSFYSGSNTYDVFSQMFGERGESTEPSSELYAALQNFMVSKHTAQTTYGDTRYLFGYTDCVQNDTTAFSSFFSGISHSSVWDEGNTWNRADIWPSSKTISGRRPSNKQQGEGADIILLRPTVETDNLNRHNLAYGESSGYYEPNDTIKGDCARIILYVYTRWGNTQKMWGSDGVIESLSVLLKWMEEDPVDTWEMGRNDAVQSITGSRNVFVDYPELAWHLFGQDVPPYMTTPSRGYMENPNPPATTVTTPTQVTQPTQHTQATAPTHLTQLTQPTLPTQPVQIIQPTQPTQVTQPTQPTEPPQPTEPVQPTEPPQPAEPVQPTEPPQPAEPVQPTEPIRSTEPIQPTEPVQPAEPIQPTEPVRPTEPPQPTEPAQTLPPTKPVQPPTVSTEPTVSSRPTQTTEPNATTEPTASGSPPTDPVPSSGPNATGATIQFPTESTGEAEGICSGEHSFMQWEILKEASAGNQGLRFRECSLCGYTETQIIPATEPSYVWVIIVIAIASGAMTAGVLLFLQSRKPND